MAYEWPNHTVRLKKSTLLPIFTCKICDELLEVATAVDECLHLFCRKCIYHKITEEGLACCPVCNIHLGPEPLKKLRQDESIESLRNKMFPSRERKVKALDIATSKTIEKEITSSPLDISTPREPTRNDSDLENPKFSIEDPNEEKEGIMEDVLDISNKFANKNIGQSLSPCENSQSIHNEGTKNDAESQEFDLHLSEPLNEAVGDASLVVEIAGDVMEAASGSKYVQGTDVEQEAMQVNDTDPQEKKFRRKKKKCKANAKDGKISTNVQGCDVELEPMEVNDSDSPVKKFKKKEIKECKPNAKDGKINTNVQEPNAEPEPVKVSDSDSQVNKSKNKENRCKANVKDGKISNNVQGSDVDLEPVKVNNSDSQVKKSKMKEKKHKASDKDEKICTNKQGSDAKLEPMKVNSDSQVNKSKKKEKGHKANVEEGKISANVQGFGAELEHMKVNDSDSQVNKSKRKEKESKANANDGRINSTNMQEPDAKLETPKVTNSGSQVKKSKTKEKKRKTNDEDEKIITYLVSLDTTKTKKVHKTHHKKEPDFEESRKSPQDTQGPTEVKILRDKSMWISLEASENQEGDAPLPQIPKKYIRIKDGSLPVSYLQKYLMKKLNLKSEDEVEITCLGHPVPPTLELQRLAKLWFIMSFKAKRITNPGSSAKDYVAVISYGRHVSHP